MKVKELIKQLKQLPPDNEIIITSMDDEFLCSEFEVHSPYDDGQAQEIILPMFIKVYKIMED